MGLHEAEGRLGFRFNVSPQVERGKGRDALVSLGYEGPAQDVDEGNDLLEGPLCCVVFCWVDMKHANPGFRHHRLVPNKVIEERWCVECVLAKGPFLAPGFEPFSGIVFEST